MSELEKTTETNPYAAPQFAFQGAETPASHSQHLLLRQFRSDMHILASIWLIVGCVPLCIVLAVLINLATQPDYSTVRRVANDDASLGGLILVATNFGCMLLGLGLAVAMWFKIMPAVYVSLVLEYLGLLLSLTLFLVSILFAFVVVLGFLFVIVKSHEVIRQAKLLTEQQIPLTTLPKQLSVKL